MANPFDQFDAKPQQDASTLYYMATGLPVPMPTAAPRKKPAANPFDAFDSAPEEPRHLGQRFIENAIDSVQRSGLGQIKRNIDPDADGFDLGDIVGDVKIYEGGVTDRALDAVFGDKTRDPRTLTPAAQQERDRQIAAQQRGEADPWHQAPGGAQAKLAAGLATLGGQFTGAAVSPENWVAPGKTIAGKIIGNAGVAGGTDALLQGGELGAGIRDEYSPEQTAMSALFGGAIGGIAGAAPYVKELYASRGKDTTPSADPLAASNIQPMPQEHIPAIQADAMQYQQMLKVGSAEDIRAFFKEKGGPQPTSQQIRRWVNYRDGVAEPSLKRQPKFDYETEYRKQAEQEYAQRNQAAVQDHVTQQMSGWKNAPQLEVVSRPDFIEDIEIRNQALQDDPKGDALGFLGSDGKIRIFSDRIPDADTANAVLFHEGLGHFGLAQKYGSRLDQVIETLIDRNVGQFAKHVAQWQKRNPKAYGGDRIRAAEEVLAEYSQNGQIKKSWQDAITAATRQFGRKMGIDLKYSDVEVNHILAMAHDAVVNGKPSAAANGFRGAMSDENSENKFMFVGPRAERFDPNSPTAYTDKAGQVWEEISDTGAKLLKPKKLDKYRDFYYLDEVLDHPELYERYPKLRDTPVTFEELLGAHGEFRAVPGNSNTGEIAIDNSLKRFFSNPKKTTLHEVQHAIQQYENRIGSGSSHLQGMNEYLNDPVEQQAFAVEDRVNMTPEQRAANRPKFMTKDQFGRGEDKPLPFTESDLNEYLRLKLMQIQNQKKGTPDPDLDDRLAKAYGDIPFDTMREAAEAWTKGNIPDLAEKVPVYDTRTGKVVREMPNRVEAMRWIEQQPHNSEFYGIDRLMTDNKYITRSQLASEPGYRAEDLEGIYKALDEGYTPTRRSFADEQKEALAAGFTPTQIKAMKELGPGELSNRLWRMQAAANLADLKIADLNKKLDTPEWSVKDQAEYLKVLADRNYLVTRIKGDRAELARALNVSKAAGSYNKDTMEQVGKLLEEAGSGLSNLAYDPTAFLKFARAVKTLMATGNPKGAHIMMAAVDKPYWEQYLNTFHMNMMLSGVSTQFKAAIDTATGIERELIEKVVAMPIGKLRQMAVSAFGKKPEVGVEPEEIAAGMFGLLRAVTEAEVYRKVAHAAKTGEGAYVKPDRSSVPVNFMNQYGAVSNPRIPIVSIPADLLSAQDTFFRSVMVNQHLYALGARAAREQLGPKASWDDVMTLGSNLAHSPTKEMLEEALDLSTRNMLINHNQLNDMLEAGRSYRPGLNPLERIGRFVMYNLAPFIRVEANSLMNRVIQRSPLAFIDPYTLSQIKAGGAKADIALAKILYGTTLIGMYWMAADPAKDYLHGSGPDDRYKNQEKQASGFSPHSVKEDGEYKVANALPLSMNPFSKRNATATTVASMRQAYEKGANQGQVGTGLKLALGSLLFSLADMSWIGTIGPAITAANSRGEDAEGKVQRAIGEHARTWAPNLLNQAARMQDGVKRDTRPEEEDSISERVINELKSTVPGLRQELPIKYNVYGQPLEQGTSLTGTRNSTSETTDPAEVELQRLAGLTKAAIITPVQRTLEPGEDDLQAILDSGRTDLKIDDQGKLKLTPAQFQEYQRLAGRAIVETVKAEMSAPEWQNMSDQERVLLVRDIQTDMKKLAREALFYGTAE